MSGQWEVVGKKKDKGSKLPVPKSANNKKDSGKNSANAGVKLEEVLSRSHVQNLYSNKENAKPKEKNGVAKTKPVQENKKPQKKTEKPQEPAKPKPPKSIESALNLIDVEEFKTIFEKSKSSYPDAPIVWLKELVHHLNQKVALEVNDPVFSNKKQGYPFCIIPSPIKSIIERSTREAGKNNLQLFFDIALNSMVTDMGKGLPALGWKFFLQYIALNEPKLTVANMSKYVTLRNSYQNRSNIGLSILWAVGQVGFSDFNSGLTVFEELMLPLVEMKNYSRYVIRYLIDLISNIKEISIVKEEYFLILDTAYSSKKNFPVDLKNELVKNVTNLKSFLFNKNNKEKYHGYIEVVLKKIIANTDKAYQNHLCDILVEVFNRDPTTLANWNKLYPKNVGASAIFLTYLSNNWNKTKINDKTFKDILNNFSLLNEELSMRKKKEEGLNTAIASIKKINEKMVTKKKSFSILKVLWILITLSLAAVIYSDVKSTGSWQGSSTQKLINSTGVCGYVHKALDKGKEGWLVVDAKIDETFPGYQKKVQDFSAPYVKLFSDIGKLGTNVACNVRDYAVEKYPVVKASIDAYAPGLIESSQTAVGNAWSTSVVYYTRSVDYLKQEVFVGQLSPENMQRVVIEAFNTTSQKATECYHWLYEKVQTNIK